MNEFSFDEILASWARACKGNEWQWQWHGEGKFIGEMKSHAEHEVELRGT